MNLDTQGITDASASDLPAVLLLPAMGVPANYYESLVAELESRGLRVTTAQLGYSTPNTDASRTAVDGYATIVERQIPAAYKEAAQSTASGQVVIVGHSLGGQLGLISAGRYWPDVPIVLVASGSAYFKGFPRPRRWLYRSSAHLIAFASSVLGYWPGDYVGFGGRQSSSIMHDWAKNVRKGTYGGGDASFEYEDAIDRFRGRILVLQIEHDKLAPIGATRLLLAKTNAMDISTVSYSPTRGNKRPGSHFTWARDAPGVTPEISAWIISATWHIRRTNTTVADSE